MFRASREYYCCSSNFRNGTRRDAPCLPYSLNYLKRPLWCYNGTSLPTHPRRNCYTFKNLTNNLLAHSHYSRQLQAGRHILYLLFPYHFSFFTALLLVHICVTAWHVLLTFSLYAWSRNHANVRQRATKGKMMLFSSCIADVINILAFARYNNFQRCTKRTNLS